MVYLHVNNLLYFIFLTIGAMIALFNNNNVILGLFNDNIIN